MSGLPPPKAVPKSVSERDRPSRSLSRLLVQEPALLDDGPPGRGEALFWRPKTGWRPKARSFGPPSSRGPPPGHWGPPPSLGVGGPAPLQEGLVLGGRAPPSERGRALESAPSRGGPSCLGRALARGPCLRREGAAVGARWCRGERPQPPPGRRGPTDDGPFGGPSGGVGRGGRGGGFPLMAPLVESRRAL